jgi:hypothetical protein
LRSLSIGKGSRPPAAAVPDNSTHFALATGHDFLKSLGISLIPATAPDFFTLSSKLLRAADAGDDRRKCLGKLGNLQLE